MKRPDLKGLEKLPLPRGYSLRTYRQGDDLHWARIISRAFDVECSAAVFRTEIAEKAPFRPERVFFLIWRDQPVGTATAWSQPGLGAGSGYVHMVAVLPEHSGKGLGKTLTTEVLRFFKKQGLAGAFLHTDESRLPAIKMYLELGFLPVIDTEDARRRWLEVFRELKRPELSHRFCGEE